MNLKLIHAAFGVLLGALASCQGLPQEEGRDSGFRGPLTIAFCDPYVPPRNNGNDILVVVPELEGGGESGYAGPEYPIVLPVFADLRPQGGAPIELFVREYGSVGLTLVSTVEDRLAYDLILGEPTEGRATVYLAPRPKGAEPTRFSVEVQALRGDVVNDITFHPGPTKGLARMEIVHRSSDEDGEGWRYTFYMRRKV